MTNQTQLLRAYKQYKRIKTTRVYAGCYESTVNGNVFRIETQENREEEGAEWVITSVSGEAHDEMDCYITHRFSLTDAQNWLVNAY